MFKKIFGFSTYERRKFITQFAESIPAGASILDAGAGTCKYKSLFLHCDYKAQDFAAYKGAEHRYVTWIIFQILLLYLSLMRVSIICYVRKCWSMCHGRIWRLKSFIVCSNPAGG